MLNFGTEKLTINGREEGSTDASPLEAALEAGYAYLDVRQVAELIGCSTDWVYQHSAELGAMRLSEGPRARLRFLLGDVMDAMQARKATSASSTRPLSPATARSHSKPKKRQFKADVAGEGGYVLPIVERK